MGDLAQFDLVARDREPCHRRHHAEPVQPFGTRPRDGCDAGGNPVREHRSRPLRRRRLFGPRARNADNHRFRHLRARLCRKARGAWPAMAAPRAARDHVSSPARRSRGVSIARGERPCEFAQHMSPRPDLGPKPRLGYCDSRIERAAELRADTVAIEDLSRKPGAGAYVIGGESIVTKKRSPLNEPLFRLDEANALSPATETIFLGVLDGAPRFGHGVTPQAAEALKSRSDLHITDLRSIAVQG